MTTRKKRTTTKDAAGPLMAVSAAENSTLIHGCSFSQQTTVSGDVSGAFTSIAQALATNARALEALAHGYAQTITAQQHKPVLQVGTDERRGVQGIHGYQVGDYSAEARAGRE